MKYYKNCNGDSFEEFTAIDAELQRLQNVIDENQKRKKLEMNDFRNAQICRGLILAIVLTLMNQSSGSYTFLTDDFSMNSEPKLTHKLQT